MVGEFSHDQSLVRTLGCNTTRLAFTPRVQPAISTYATIDAWSQVVSAGCFLQDVFISSSCFIIAPAYATHFPIPPRHAEIHCYIFITRCTHISACKYLTGSK
mgnify:FL=1